MKWWILASFYNHIPLPLHFNFARLFYKKALKFKRNLMQNQSYKFTQRGCPRAKLEIKISFARVKAFRFILRFDFAKFLPLNAFLENSLAQIHTITSQNEPATKAQATHFLASPCCPVRTDTARFRGRKARLWLDLRR